MKDKILTWIFIAFAHLPFGVLYGLSDVVGFILYHIIRYRRKVVRNNLRNCYPDLSNEELCKIERQFYRNFTDNFVETLKLLHISDEEMRTRMEFIGTSIIDDLLAKGKSIVVYFAHTFNWEWAPSISLHTTNAPSDSIVFAQVYRPLRNKTFDKLMLRIRSRFGSESLPKASTLRHLLNYKRNNKQSITGFMSDQHPSHGDSGVATTFLGQPTLMISGTETLARRLDMAVVYWDMEHPRRGHYRITTRLITETPNELAQNEITLRYTRLLEDTINRDPAIWLWSHKRWKHPVIIPENQK